MITDNPFRTYTLESYRADGRSTGEVLRSVGRAVLQDSDSSYRKDVFIHDDPAIEAIRMQSSGPLDRTLYKTATALVEDYLTGVGLTPNQYFAPQNADFDEAIPLQQRYAFAQGLREAMREDTVLTSPTQGEPNHSVAYSEMMDGLGLA